MKSGITAPKTSTTERASTAVARAVEEIAALPGNERAKAVAVAAETLAHAAVGEPERRPRCDRPYRHYNRKSLLW